MNEWKNQPIFSLENLLENSLKIRKKMGFSRQPNTLDLVRKECTKGEMIANLSLSLSLYFWKQYFLVFKLKETLDPTDEITSRKCNLD